MSHPLSDALVSDLASYGVPRPRARKVVGRFLRRHEAVGATEEDPRIVRLDELWTLEILHPILSKAESRRKAKKDREVAALTAKVDSRAAKRRTSDPGPVASRKAAQTWANASAVKGRLWHATRAGSSVMTEGLLSREAKIERLQAAGVERPWALIQTLGGGAGTMVSAVLDRTSAVRIAAALQALNEARVDPNKVFDWFAAHWGPFLGRNDVTIPGWRAREVASQLVLMKRTLEDPRKTRSDYPQYLPGQHLELVRKYINDFAYYFHDSPQCPDAFRIPWIQKLPPRVDPKDVGVVELRANVDAVYRDVRGKKSVRGVLDFDGLTEHFHIGCPAERGGPRSSRPPEMYRNPEVAVLGRAAVAYDTMNPFESGEYQLCPTDVTVVGFTPVLDWRRILKPKYPKAGSLGRRGRHVPTVLRSPPDLEDVQDPFMEQERRCRTRIFFEKLKQGKTVREAVSASFAICRATLQKGGYHHPGTARPTRMGMMRSLQMLAEPDARRRRDEFFAMEQTIRADKQKRQVRHAVGQNERDRRRGRHVIDLDALIEEVAAPRRRRVGAASVDPGRSAVKDVAAALQEAAEKVYRCDTTFGDCLPRRPSRGHCLPLSMIAQDVMGGSLIEGQVDGIPHYWLRTRGFDVDLTADQFGRASVIVRKSPLRQGRVFPRKAGKLLVDAGDNRAANKVYLRLKHRIANRLGTSGFVKMERTLRRAA